MPYIYKITNTVNNKVYIGKTNFSVEKRWQEHCEDYTRFNNRPLYAAMRKYGINKFQVETIEEVENDEQACNREIYWIAFYNSYHYGYNATYGGDGKQLYDPRQIWSLWEQGYSIKQIVKLVDCCRDTVSACLDMYDIDTQERYKRGRQALCRMVFMLDKNTHEELKVFESTRAAARYLITTYGLNPKNEGGYSTHISEVCNNKRKTCQGFGWRYGGVV